MIACQLGEDFLEGAYPCQTDETFPLAGGGRGVTSTAATPTSSQGRPGLGACGPPLPARLAWSASVSKVTGRLVTASLAARERQRQGGSARRRVLSCCPCLPSPPPAPATRPWSGSPPFPAQPSLASLPASRLPSTYASQCPGSGEGVAPLYQHRVIRAHPPASAVVNPNSRAR